jgi:hypothetical protein
MAWDRAGAEILLVVVRDKTLDRHRPPAYLRSEHAMLQD